VTFLDTGGDDLLAKAIAYSNTDVEARKRGEQTGLDKPAGSLNIGEGVLFGREIKNEFSYIGESLILWCYRPFE